MIANSAKAGQSTSVSAAELLQIIRDTLEELDDGRELARAKKKNAGKPGTDWQTVKKEFGFKF